MYMMEKIQMNFGHTLIKNINIPNCVISIVQ
jgi:hypothetical protein